MMRDRMDLDNIGGVLMKRFVALCVVFMLLMLGVATAENSNVVYWSGDWRYRYVTANTVEIAGYVGDETTITLPTQLSGIRVVRIGDWAFSNAPRVEKVIIPKEITSIAEYAFEDSSITVIETVPRHPTLEVVDGVVYSKPDSSLVYYPPHLPYAHYNVKGGTKRIRTNARRLLRVSSENSRANVCPSMRFTMGIFMVMYSFFFVQGFGVSLTLCLYNTKRSVHMYGLNVF
jgi:hypothetical protein